MKIRELKFRAWEPFKKKMTEPFSLGSVLCEEYGGSQFIMQYIGLKDKKGREIYEGDIVKTTQFLESEICTVKWEEVQWFPFSTDDVNESGYGKPENCEIIGNTFENPELLKT